MKFKIRDGSIDLSLRELKEVPIHDIAVAKVYSLNLSGNQLVTLDNNFILLTHLVELDLSKNNLISLPDNFGTLQFLKHLDLHNNQLRELPLSFGKLKNLTWLNLKNNNLPTALVVTAGPCDNDQQCHNCAIDVVKFVSKAEKRLAKEFRKFELWLFQEEMEEKASGKKKQSQKSQSQQQKQQQQQQQQKQQPQHQQQKQQSPQKQQKQESQHWQQKQQHQQQKQQPPQQQQKQEAQHQIQKQHNQRKNQQEQKQKKNKGKQLQKSNNEENGMKRNSNKLWKIYPNQTGQKKKNKGNEINNFVNCYNNFSKSSKKKPGSSSKSFFGVFLTRTSYILLILGFIYIVDFEKFVRIRDSASYYVNKTVSLLPAEVVTKGKQAIEIIQPVAEVTLNKTNVLIKEATEFLNTNPLIKDHWINVREISSICSARLVDYLRTLYLHITGYCNDIKIKLFN